MSAVNKFLTVRGARVHNLKNINLSIPKDKLCVFTGLSGSGKSSLAFDTIFAEGRRRYMESLSTYARQFLGKIEKPDVDSIEGLSPAISIEQKSINANPRSTVGTLTEIYDYMRILWARIGKMHCVLCREPVASYSAQDVTDFLLQIPENEQYLILSPVLLTRKRSSDYQTALDSLREQGYIRVLINGNIEKIEDIKLNSTPIYSLYTVVDRLCGGEERSRVADSVETAYRLSAGELFIYFLNTGKERKFTERLECSQGHPVELQKAEPRLFSFNSPLGACIACAGLGYIADKKTLCNLCQGSRLKPESLSVLIKGKSIFDISSLPLIASQAFFAELSLEGNDAIIAKSAMREIQNRLNFLNNLGLGYLTLSRSVYTLSGGEAQRIKLATQIGSALTGVLYVLDEPSIGLHQRDNHKLIEHLLALRDLGNTIIVVEHDEDTINAADWIVDFGPYAGELGGEVLHSGTLLDLHSVPNSITGMYLSGKRKIAVPKKRRKPDPVKSITITGANKNNLKNINVKFPLGLLTAVCGVSGSGKSSLVHGVLKKALIAHLDKKPMRLKTFNTISGLNHISKVIDINQSPIGRTPRSNPATYTGVFDHIRALFAQTKLSKLKGYTAGRFSFNLKGGRCENCLGDGSIKIEMNFLPDVYLTCLICSGKRYNTETLQVQYKGKTIADVLNMTVSEAYIFFENLPIIKRHLSALIQVGLDYLRLGQPATTLSGGEAQRVKLATELYKRSNSNVVYLLDEPTTGLHFEDVNKLVGILHSLVDRGNTVIVIEHNLDIIKNADYIIDMGPDGGDGGGQVVACGTPEEITKNKNSVTGEYIKF